MRLDVLEQSTLKVAKWLADQPLVRWVLHPAMASCPGHDIWARDFIGSTSVFSFVFDDNIRVEQVIDFINNLDIFKIGMSWGGVNSLAVVYPDLIRPNQDFAGRIVRLNIGLEMVDDLIADLDQALRKLV